MDNGLKGRVVFITGAGGGIGRSIARHFGAEGSRVIATDIDAAAAERTAAEIREAGGEADAHGLDVARRDAVFAVVGTVTRKHGKIDVLVNNAGVVGLAKIEEITDAEFDRLYGVNVKGKLWCMQAAVPSMKAQNWGRIVNLCSVSGKTGGRLPYAHYTSSKGAVWTMTMAAAHEFAPWNINCNGVAPGSVIGTAFSKDFELSNDPEVLRASIPLARRGQPDDIAPAVVFLASEGARYITGELIDVNGGLHMD
ncbi:SDR family NAD(P)-dependent oxidoreductase [Chelatococcus asaccharovorans]|uniref:3-oxoacyl-[acyl-carrier protein] reductase n=1 Tax=Chelatococcus asaccharovorans TaxID=28210 RepID=A0A2V3UEL3_9HYPH|nr:SDR family NAD(P)-dependent oxidoreductase [Chelatococcus asaccharovorans]MBS7707308.1 SDR family oxidoreductase [Chelatococcus asaccharovorans]PXW63490.1 3-oxoacyl-[acyl-carrier protein] reductase [Chelatococcus asaccharovorans]